MHRQFKMFCAAIAALALTGGVAAAPGGAHGAGGQGAGGSGNHADSPPDTSNRQSLPDAERGLDRAGERESDSGIEHSQSRERHQEHAPDHGVQHRNEHAAKKPGQGAHDDR
jgi:hypothetical protein